MNNRRLSRTIMGDRETETWKPAVTDMTKSTHCHERYGAPIVTHIYSTSYRPCEKTLLEPPFAGSFVFIDISFLVRQVLLTLHFSEVYGV